MTDTQPVVIDPVADDSIRLNSNITVGDQRPPVATNYGSGLTLSYLQGGRGVVRYHSSGTATGSQQLQPIAFSKQHKLLRVEIELNTSSGVPDTFTGQVAILRYLGGNITNADGQSNLNAYIILAQTTSSTPGGSIVFEFGENAWANDPCTYAILLTAPNTDLLFYQFILEYQ